MTTRPLSVHVIMLKAKVVLGLPPLPACQTSSQVSRPIWLAVFPCTAGKGPGGLGSGVLQFCRCLHPLPDRTMPLTLASPHDGWCWPWETE